MIMPGDGDLHDEESLNPGAIFKINTKYKFNIKDLGPVTGQFLSAMYYGSGGYIITIRRDDTDKPLMSKFEDLRSWEEV